MGISNMIIECPGYFVYLPGYEVDGGCVFVNKIEGVFFFGLFVMENT
jgi:hypothetical protein